MPKKPKSCPCIPPGLYPWMVLAAICFLTFGSYWVYDTPGAIQTPLTYWFQNSSRFQDNFIHNFDNTRVYSSSMNSLLYAVYSFPNIILAFFGGYIVDRFTGVRAGAILFCSLVLIGQIFFSISLNFGLYWGCVMGRFIYGLGGESLTVSQSTFTARWFEGKLLALAFGITVSFSRIGSSVNFIVTPTIASIDYSDTGGNSETANDGVPLAVWFGTLMCVLSLGAALIAATLDYLGRDRIKVIEKNVDDEKPSLTHVKYFPLPAWFVMLATMLFYIAVLVFYQVASDIMQHTGKMYSATTASYFLAIPNIISIFASPSFGFIIDKYGKALFYVIGASFALVLGHLAFLANALDWFQINPAFIMVWIGLAYSAGAASVWPIIANVINESLLATAYGMMTSMQNFGLAVFPLLISEIQQSICSSGSTSCSSTQQNYYYATPIIIFIICAFSSGVLMIINVFLDKKMTQGRLNASSEQRKKLGDLPNPLSRTEAGEKRSLINSKPDQIFIETESVSVPYKSLLTDETGDDDDDIYKVPIKPRDTSTVRKMYLARLGFNPIAPHF